ncbi:GntR family transcriptional regulator [Bosea sp. (in: a-proteobacteria)]|uniref:GntR family transcriptional regulator n=1 Tax=Bosea sp. (in: a-proteobacteria) TaxID=1871050 RepID=UPI0025C30601|nr:GntR family transcriptional regulator [Bosea sp. (in: a-proteobacteria)]MBR3191958.1 GntR family transcriptional regulator [Bosea sp. (in: a-proteobacteria)]
MTTPTRLQQEIAERILRMVREDGLEAGAWLNENSAARRLNVSRTPVRAAIDHLARQGLVRRHPNKGVELLSAPEASADPNASADATELAMVRVAQDRHGGRLPDEISELELMRRYELGRPEVQRLMARLADLDMVERKRGYGWRFLHEPRDQSAHDERYRFRLLIEPMVFLEPGFSLDQGWIDEMRTRHELTLSQPWKESSAIGLYEMNADFHEGLAAASGNRFIHSAIRRQNQMRRLSNYDWTYGYERVVVNTREHLQMLATIEAGDLQLASALMRSHLQRAMQLRRADGLD